ncbi:Putative aliphatic sulfonates-binding protein [Kordia antarctica]|uniref:Aliphatic sulfonates-binding protein n=1 Tax=Kordia antarctica TaxID=1218801 RepID=A0A7L4ZGA3_9FLAO|nr:NrtA/SsuA/CpmA family ABC transporter substrate-binding protein [Kordia antarctica]QHI35778.1 Putative aliphatic sulfonates-binding protein [Kordia antarctica]
MKKIIVITISCIILYSCKQKQKTVNLTSPKTAFSMLTIIADQKGFFKKQDIDVNINYVKTGKIALDDLLGGNADFANIVETNVAFAGFLNANIEVYCNIEKVYDAGIVARVDKGINTPKDLNGKKIGVLLATTSQVYADRFLEKHGISKDSVELVNLLPPAMQSAIIEGSGVDAISIWQPYIYNVQKALGNENQVTFNDTEIFTGYMTLSGNKKFANENPEITEKLIKAYIEAEEYVKNNEKEAKTLISSFLNLPLETLENIWKQYDLSISLDQKLIDDTKAEGEWIIKTIDSYKNKSLPNYSQFFNSTYLEKVSPNKVKILEAIEN